MPGGKIGGKLSAYLRRKQESRPPNPPNPSNTYEPLSDAHAAYLKDLVKRAGKKDGTREIFGSSKHGYKLNPTVTQEEVRRFEAHWHLTLPDEYVFFLTKVGNGGAGPYYGLYSLENLARYNEYLGFYDDRDKEALPSFIDRNMSPVNWARAMEEMEDINDDNEYDARMKQVCSGLLVIGTQGCTYDNLLMWKGSERGKIVYIDWNMEPEYGPFLTGLTFLEWFEQYFLEILAGHNLTSYGYISLKSQQELRKEYEGAVLTEDKLRILAGFHKFTEAEPETIELLLQRDRPETDGAKGELLFKLAPMKGLKVFEETIVGNHPQGAVACARRMPDQYKDRFYGKMLGLLYRPDIKDKARILFFLGDCSNRKAADLKGFAENMENSSEDRRTAVYVMGKCPDKLDFAEFFAKLMQGEDYWLAHAALQAMSRTPCAELIDTYEWMWKRYEEDRMMRSNLQIAFEANGIEKK